MFFKFESPRNHRSKKRASGTPTMEGRINVDGIFHRITVARPRPKITEGGEADQLLGCFGNEHGKSTLPPGKKPILSFYKIRRAVGPYGCRIHDCVVVNQQYAWEITGRGVTNHDLHASSMGLANIKAAGANNAVKEPVQAPPPSIEKPLGWTLRRSVREASRMYRTRSPAQKSC